MKGQQNIFISHMGEDEDGIGKLKELAARHGLTVRDSSIGAEGANRSGDRDYVVNNVIRPCIDWCSTLVVYITRRTKDSAWIDDEVRQAANGGKRIVGVWADGHVGCELPDSLAGTAEAVVAQHGKRVIDALSQEFTGAEETGGRPQSQQQSGNWDDGQSRNEATDNQEEGAMSGNRQTESFSLKEYMKDRFDDLVHRFDDLVDRLNDTNRRMDQMEHRLSQRMDRSDDRQFRIETWIARGFAAIIALLLAMLGLMVKQSFFGPGGF